MSPTIRRLPAVPGFPRRTRTRTIRACWIPAQASWARYWCPKSAWNCRFGMVRPEPVLAVGAGHLYGTSLPVGGTDSHTVVTGHRGLVKSLMFTRLDELHDGDFMYIKVMDETLGIRSGPNQRDRTGRRLTVENRARRRPADVDDLHAIRHQHASAASLRASRRNTAARARSGRRARRTCDRTGRARHDHRLHDGRHAVVLHGRAVDAAPTLNHAARFPPGRVKDKGGRPRFSRGPHVPRTHQWRTGFKRSSIRFTGMEAHRQFGRSAMRDGHVVKWMKDPLAGFISRCGARMGKFTALLCHDCDAGPAPREPARPRSPTKP